MVIRTFEEAVARHGKPERAMEDGGSANWSVARQQPLLRRC